MKSNIKQHWLFKKSLLASLLLSCLFTPLALFAVGPYAPGSTLMPACAPGAINCTVRLFPSQLGNEGRVLGVDSTGNLIWIATTTTNGVGLLGDTLTTTVNGISSSLNLGSLFSSSTRTVSFGAGFFSSFVSNTISGVTGFFGNLTGGSVTGGSVTATSSLISNGTLLVTGQSTLGNLVTGTATTTGLNVLGDARFYFALRDSEGNVGAFGQVLSSTGTSTKWITASSGGTSLASGTTVGSVLYWNGSAWVENTAFMASLLGATSTGSFAIIGQATLATTSATSLSANFLTVTGQTNLGNASATNITASGMQISLVPQQQEDSLPLYLMPPPASSRISFHQMQQLVILRRQVA